MTRARTVLRPRARSSAPALAAGALLLGGLLSGCGGGDGSSADATPTASASGGALSGASAPKDADTQKFCDTYAAIVKDGNADLAGEKKAIGQLNAIGTPADMPADARQGYELLVDAIGKATTEAELSQLGQQLSKDQTATLLSFSQYLTTTCAAELGVGPGASASASPTSPSPSASSSR